MHCMSLFLGFFPLSDVGFLWVSLFLGWMDWSIGLFSLRSVGVGESSRILRMVNAEGVQLGTFSNGLVSISVFAPLMYDLDWVVTRSLIAILDSFLFEPFPFP